MAERFALYPYRAGMVLRLRKPHPCGGTDWTLERIGADARIVCRTCGHALTLSRRKLERATRAIVDTNETGHEEDTHERT